jgi:hypothetical protein
MPATRGPESEATAAKALADAAGLRRAWAEHRAEVEEAVSGLAALRASFSRPADPAAEPAPPYAAPAARRKVGGR